MGAPPAVVGTFHVSDTALVPLVADNSSGALDTATCGASVVVVAFGSRTVASTEVRGP